MSTENATVNQNRWLRGADGIARYLGLSKRKVTHLISQGLPVKRLGARALLIQTADLDRWINGQADEYASQTGKAEDEA